MKYMRLMKTEDAVGQVLCHDITQIIKDVKKDVVFKKGHVIREKDIAVLLSVGKDSIYIWEKDDSMLHENEAAQILADLCKNEFMEFGQVKEGKIEVFATQDGLLKVHGEGIKVINSFGQMMVATRHGNFPVQKGDLLAGTRIIPLVIEKEKMQQMKEQCLRETKGNPILSLLPFQKKKVGLITTGNEVFYGRIKDTFSPVVEEKFAQYGSEILFHETFPDNDSQVTESILQMIEKGCQIICVTGGMSVDPDDRTPLAIKNTGAQVITYGTPVLPGAMFLLAYYKKTDGTEVPIMGLPGCVMYAGRTIFDLVLPRVLADDPVSTKELSALGEGGLCLNCPTCIFPNCGFGKGK